MGNCDFFQNQDCEYFPCHKGMDEKNFNCLFCYCPLYSMENCPGNYSYIQANGKRIKVCSECNFPHIAANYDRIIKILSE